MNLVYLYLIKRAPEKAILQLKEVLALEPGTPKQKNWPSCFFRKAVLTSASASSKSRAARCSRVVAGDFGRRYLAKNDLSKAEEYYWWHSKAGSTMPERCLVWRSCRG